MSTQGTDNRDFEPLVQRYVSDNHSDVELVEDRVEGDPVAVVANGYADLFGTAANAAHELPDEYDPLAVLENLPEILDAVRRANIDLSDVQALVARNELHNRRTIDAAKERLDDIHEVARGESDALTSAEGDHER